MLMLKRFLTATCLGLALLALPQTAQAQGCNDRCVDIVDEEGSHVGFGCTTGGSFTNCQASTEECTLDGCGLAAVMYDDGTRLALLPECELDQLSNYVAESTDEEYIDERYLATSEQ